MYCEFVIICGMLIFRESRGLLQIVKLSIQWIYIIINIYFHYVDIHALKLIHSITYHFDRDRFVLN
jgi:hypothetical protein